MTGDEPQPNLQFQYSTLYISLIISFFSRMLKRYIRIRRDGSWIFAVRLKSLTSLCGQRKMSAKMYHISKADVTGQPQGLLLVFGPIILTQNGGPSERCGSHKWRHNSHRTVRADSQHALWGFYSQVSDHFLTIQILFLLYLLLRLKNPLHKLIIYIVSF